MKQINLISNNKTYNPKSHRSYSIDEIISAGGSTAFAQKVGKKVTDVSKKLSQIPEDALLSENELNMALATLNDSK